jgi:hypothetical protein
MHDDIMQDLYHAVIGFDSADTSLSWTRWAGQMLEGPGQDNLQRSDLNLLTPTLNELQV